MQNIQEWQQKIKNGLGDTISEWGTIIIVFLMAFASFGLGRLSAFEEARPPVSIKTSAETQPALAVQGGGEVVASKSGTAYHFPWCAGATQIAEKNKITFKSAEAARAAGYRPAKNCKGLK